MQTKLVGLALLLAISPAVQSQELNAGELCIAQFISTSQADKAYRECVQKAFFEVAKQWPLFKDAVLLDRPALCNPYDVRCFSDVGRLAHCQNVLVGSSSAVGNGFLVSFRIFEVGKARVMPGSEAEQLLVTDRQADAQAWAERQACRALQAKCVGKIVVDPTRRAINIYSTHRPPPPRSQTPT